MKDVVLAGEPLVAPTPFGEPPNWTREAVEFPQTTVLDVGGDPILVPDPERPLEYSRSSSRELAGAPVQDQDVVELSLSLASVQVQQNNFFYFGRDRVRPTEELRVVQSELETAIRKLTYEDDNDAGFLPSKRSRRQSEGFASAHATAHVLRRTNEALRALTNAVHVLHTIEKKKYAV